MLDVYIYIYNVFACTLYTVEHCVKDDTNAMYNIPPICNISLLQNIVCC